MADSDGEYPGDNGSDDELQMNGGPGTGARARNDKKGSRKAGKAAWEDIQRSWDQITEGVDGSLAATIEGLAEAEKRARLLRDTTPLQRGIIRHLVLVLDMSQAMAEKDMLPTRHTLTMAYARDFVREYFEQNPISQLAVIGMRDGIAVRISDMSGNPAEHQENLKEWVKKDPQGSPSLQNALEMCRGALFHTPTHGTREVLIIYGALMSSDPGNIHDTQASLIKDRIRVSIIGLAAQVAICAEICSKTNAGSKSNYTVALHEQHYRDLLMAATTPPATRAEEQSNASLLMMGFPSRALAAGDSIHYCACHSRPTREGYLCTRCGARVCRLPAECPGCSLTLILSTHLARSYHHLFPLRNWVEVSWADASAKRSRACYSCMAPFPEIPAHITKPRRLADKAAGGGGSKGGAGAVVAARAIEGLSESGRYACSVCGSHFCIDCDLLAHEVLHNCPGCQSDTRGLMDTEAAGQDSSNGVETTSSVPKGDHVNGNSAMEIDS